MINMNDKILHMIGNAHIDPVWLWHWQEGCHEVLASFRSALDRLKEYEDFIFVSSSAAFYAWVEQINPEMFAEIRQRVQEGRWEIVGGWWIQPDCNIPAGESFVRQGLYGQRYFQEKFGLKAQVGYNVDSFGHNGMLPQILKKSGLDTYVFMRPSPQEKGLPNRLFWWESDDGSRILTFRLPFQYTTWGKEVDLHVRRCAGELREPFNQIMCFYGVGNHGGGPTRENIESIHRLNADPDYPELRFSSPQRFFGGLRPDKLPIPVVHGDLQHHASGCYAAHSGVKRWNREAEGALLAAEKFATIASLVSGQPYPQAEFKQAWHSVLFNQFHDILAGTSLETAYNDVRNQYGEALAIAARAQNVALQSLAWNIHIPPEEGMRPIVVFNPHAWASRVNVEVELGRVTAEQSLVDDQDHFVPHQLIQPAATVTSRSRIAFIADLPPLGYRVYRVVNRPAPEITVPFGEAGDALMENGCFRLLFDPETGYLKSLRDRRYDIEVLAGDAAIPLVVEDQSDTWSHNVFSFQKEIGRFKAVSVRPVAHGPVKSTIRVVSAYERSQLIQDFTLYPDLDYIDVQATVNWQEQFKALKLRFPINVQFMRATSEIPYGFVDRFANGEEEPGQSWVDLSGSSRANGERYGVSILNDSKYSYDINVQDIGLTILRSPIYAHHDPAVPQPDETYTFIDQGIQRFRYAIYPHALGWEEAGTVRRAAELNQHPIPFISTYHPEGSLPQSHGYVSVDRPNIVVTVLKQAEDGEDLILRCYESTKTATSAVISLALAGRTQPAWALHADFGPCEIKTFRIPRDDSRPVGEVNLLEESTK